MTHRTTRPLLLVLAAVLAACGSKKSSSSQQTQIGNAGDPCLLPQFACATGLACIDARCGPVPAKAGDACDLSTSCPSGLGCVFGRCATLAGSGAACGPQAPCASGLFCAGVTATGGGTCQASLPSATCTPPTSLPSSTNIVSEGTVTIDPATLAKYSAVPFQTTADAAHCVLPIQTPLQGTTAQQLGTHQVGTQVGFTVAPGTVSFSIVSQESDHTALDSFIFSGSTFPNSVVPTDVTLPSGTVAYDDTAIPFPQPDPDAYARLLAYYGASSVSDGAFTVPNTTRSVQDVSAAGALPPGGWSAVVNDVAFEANATGGTNGQYDLAVISRPGPLTSTGTVDVAVYLVTKSTLTSTSAVTDPHFQRWTRSVALLLGRAGICVGTFHVYDLPPALVNLWYSINIDQDKPCDPLAQMFTVSSGTNAPGAIQLFLTDDLTASGLQPGQSLAGIDGTIPGPSLVPGLINSGAAVAIGTDLDGGTCGAGFDPIHCGADFLAYIGAHESGHWLGLYHLTESGGTLFDPITDTPACQCSSCASTNAGNCGKSGSSAAQVTASDCTKSTTCGGGDNLMFWIYQDGPSQGTLTSQQAMVMRLNPAVH